VKLRRKALPLEYYYDIDPQPACDAGYNADNVSHRDNGGTAVVTIAPMGNGRVRETTMSIPEEDADDGDSPDHHNS